MKPEQLVGTWTLVTSTRRILDTGEVVPSYGGEHPTGWINYSPEGRVMVIVAYEGRLHPSASEVLTMEAKAALFETFFAYSGTYRCEGDQVIHEIDTSWNESWSGTTMVRAVQVEGDRVIYSTTPFPFSGDGRLSVVTLIWRKLPSPGIYEVRSKA